MSLTLALNTALSGLNVNQAALATVSNNIANANTEGYSRQNVEQSPIILDGVGAGVRIDDISRKVDKYLDRSIQREISNVGQSEPISDYYQRLQILLGEPGADNSIDEYVENYFNALQSLAETPNRVSFQATAVDTAEVLAREISGLAGSLEDLRYQADQDIAEAVDAINILLGNLDNLNVAINRANALNTSTAGLLDQRDLALEQLSGYMDIEIYYKSSGAVNVFVANGAALVDENRHELSYRPSSGVNALVANTAVNPLQVLTFDEDGEQIGTPENIISGGVEGAVTSRLEGGSIEGLRQLRDDLLPDILSQLDMLASRLRDEVNAIHNNGSGFPPADDLTGTRLVRADESYDWSGTAQITVLSADGSPATSTYADESHTGYRPLDLDFDFLNSGNGAGVPTMQTIIDEINNHFNAPPVKAVSGNMNNIQIVSNINTVPFGGAPPQFIFDLDLENISGTESELWLTNVSIVDNLGAAVSSSGAGTVTDTVPRVNIASYDFTNGSQGVTINTTLPHNLQVGERVILEDPGALGFPPGVANVNLTGPFTITGVTGNSFTVQMNGATAGATLAGLAAAPGTDALPPYQEVAAGDKTRTRDAGVITADLSANGSAPFYDVTITTTTYDNDPNNPQYTTGTLTYRVFNDVNKLNDRYDVTNTTGQVQRQFPGTPHQYIFARLVDENGVELPQSNGSYGSQSGFLQLVANDLGGQELGISINEGTSQQQGVLTLANPAQTGTNRGFSHYFELNNFFVSNNPTATGDTDDNSAINFAVDQRILDNPSLISTGQVERSNQPADPTATPLYTFERYPSNNTIAQALAGLSFQQISFGAAGGLPDTTLTLNGFVGEMLGFIASKSAAADAKFRDNSTLLNGLVQRADAISGVNLDEELANTTIYQNAYAASARVIAVTDELFAELLATFG